MTTDDFDRWSEEVEGPPMSMPLGVPNAEEWELLPVAVRRVVKRYIRVQLLRGMAATGTNVPPAILEYSEELLAKMVPEAQEILNGWSGT